MENKCKSANREKRTGGKGGKGKKGKRVEREKGNRKKVIIVEDLTRMGQGPANFVVL